MDMFVLAAVAVLAAMAGFWAGRSLQWQLAEGMMDGEDEEGTGSGGGIEGRGKNGVQRKISLGQVIASPVAGIMTGSMEDGRPVISINPEQGRVYAPAAGRITRLYPMGSAMKLRTEFGAELLIQVGSRVDEMQSDLYRCRVMEREVVRKGKLLLEYDVDGLRAEGAGPEVTMRVENGESDSVAMAGNARVNAGDEVMWVKDHSSAKREH